MTKTLALTGIKAKINRMPLRQWKLLMFGKALLLPCSAMLITCMAMAWPIRNHQVQVGWYYMTMTVIACLGACLMAMFYSYGWPRRNEPHTKALAYFVGALAGVFAGLVFCMMYVMA